MSDGGQATTEKPGPGWYPDPWTPSRRRYWNGSSWTFATLDAVPVDHPPPEDTSALPPGHRLPDPVVRRAAATTEPEPAVKAAASKAKRRLKWSLAVLVGVLVGVLGIVILDRTSSDGPSTEDDVAVPPTPTLEPGPSATDNNDPSQNVLGSLVVRPSDVVAPVQVVILPGGIGLAQPTLDLCDGRYPSESRRTARAQDAVVDGQGDVVLSTEAVLYDGAAATTQAFGELRSVVAACTTDTFGPPPDAGWPQTPSVNRVAYDFTTDDGSGPRRIIAVYLQRGRALVGVYFLKPEGPQPAVEGKTTMEEIVAIFAGRLAALPTSVVGS